MGDPAQSFEPEPDRRSGPTDQRKRLAIIGGGIGGISTAYFCDSSWQVDVFERRQKLGGHADSVSLDHEGCPVTIDLGAQFFHPATHPLYSALLEELSIYRPERPLQSDLIRFDGSLTVLQEANGRANFVSPRFPDRLWPMAEVSYWSALRAFAGFSSAARTAIIEEHSWDVSIEEWLERGPWSRLDKDLLLYPWFAATLGAPLEATRRVSARAMLQTFGLALPRRPWHPSWFFNVRMGMQSVVEAMARRCGSLTIHLNAEITLLRREGQVWRVEAGDRSFGPYDAVVLACAPHDSRSLLTGMEFLAGAQELLGRSECFSSRIVIHRDAVYMPTDRRCWSSINAASRRDSCELSIWLRDDRGASAGGRPHGVFKSWASRRAKDPTALLLEREFKHPLLTPSAIAAARTLNRWQGRHGLWYGGHWPAGVDLQETGVFSATRIAEHLDAQSVHLRSWKSTVAKRGHRTVAYDL